MSDPFEQIDQSLRIVIDKLKNANRQIKSITQTAKKMLDDNQKEVGKKKLEEKMDIIIQLPESLKPQINKINAETRQKIISLIRDFAVKAETFLDKKDEMGMKQFLTDEDEDNQNDLESLIEELQDEL